MILETARAKLRAALAAIESREGQWMHDDNTRYVELSVAEMKSLLATTEPDKKEVSP